MKQRNHVALALLTRGGGTKVHKKSRKAQRRAESVQHKKDVGADVDLSHAPGLR